MYQAVTVAFLTSMMPLASAHYFFDKLVVNGQASPEFVRSNTRSIAYMPTKWKNTFDNTTPDSTDFRCNVGATNKGAKATANVKAGDSLAMTLGVGARMEHPGQCYKDLNVHETVTDLSLDRPRSGLHVQGTFQRRQLRWLW
jgi:hypothetical protein